MLLDDVSLRFCCSRVLHSGNVFFDIVYHASRLVATTLEVSYDSISWELLGSQCVLLKVDFNLEIGNVHTLIYSDLGPR